MKICRLGLSLALVFGFGIFSVRSQSPIAVTAGMQTPATQWQDCEVGFLGDSMSTLCDTTQNKRFYDYLRNLIGIRPHVYARSGWQWKNLLGQVSRMKLENPSLDAVMLWAGTNDYNHNCPIGEFFTESVAEVNVNGRMETRRCRHHVMTDSTFCGRINMLLSELKRTFPEQQIILLTPIHRGFARFSDRNVQPSEQYSNGLGLYIDDYVRAIREAGSIWSVPVIDFFALSGIYPADSAHDCYIQNPETDRLHPNTFGHFRLARTLQYQLLSLPSNFK